MFYSGLVAELYDDFFQELDQQEFDFYARHIQESQSPALEVGCGTGRLLIPLVQKGLKVEGFDASQEMLRLCKSKAQVVGAAPVLYHQNMRSLALPKKYGCIFSPLGTFQQLAYRDDALHALQAFYEHLLPGGRLIMYLHLPWYNYTQFGSWTKKTFTKNNKTIFLKERAFHDAIEQLVVSELHYHVDRDGQHLFEKKEMTIRWYSRFEFQMMLTSVGFRDIEVQAGYRGDGPFDVMLFVARKPS